MIFTFLHLRFDDLNLRTGDTVKGLIRPPKDSERYYALLQVDSVNFDAPEKARQRIHFDNLTPLYPTERFRMEHDPSEFSLVSSTC